MISLDSTRPYIPMNWDLWKGICQSFDRFFGAPFQEPYSFLFIPYTRIAPNFTYIIYYMGWGDHNLSRSSIYQLKIVSGNQRVFTLTRCAVPFDTTYLYLLCHTLYSHTLAYSRIYILVYYIS